MEFGIEEQSRCRTGRLRLRGPPDRLLLYPVFQIQVVPALTIDAPVGHGNSPADPRSHIKPMSVGQWLASGSWMLTAPLIRLFRCHWVSFALDFRSPECSMCLTGWVTILELTPSLTRIPSTSITRCTPPTYQHLFTEKYVPQGNPIWQFFAAARPLFKFEAYKLVVACLHGNMFRHAKDLVAPVEGSIYPYPRTSKRENGRKYCSLPPYIY